MDTLTTLLCTQLISSKYSDLMKIVKLFELNGTAVPISLETVSISFENYRAQLNSEQFVEEDVAILNNHMLKLVTDTQPLNRELAVVVYLSHLRTHKVCVFRDKNRKQRGE